MWLKNNTDERPPFFFFFIPPFWNLACKWIPPQEPWFHLSFGTSFPHWVVLKEGHQCISKVSSGGSCSHESTKCFFPLPTYSSTLPRTRWRSRSVPKSPGTRRCPWCQSPYFSPSGWCSTRTPFCVWSMSTNLWRWIVVGADVDVVLLIKTRLKKRKRFVLFLCFSCLFFLSHYLVLPQMNTSRLLVSTFPSLSRGTSATWKVQSASETCWATWG